MIEDKFRKWLIEEIEHDCLTKAELSSMLLDDDDAYQLFRSFYIWHRPDIIEIVQTQIKSVLKKDGL